MSGPDLPRPAQRIGPRTTLQKLLSRFHFGITLFAVALSGLTILLAGVTALRGYADRNMELAAQLGAYGVEPALVPFQLKRMRLNHATESDARWLCGVLRRESARFGTEVGLQPDLTMTVRQR